MKWINPETGHVVEDFSHTDCDKFRCSSCPLNDATEKDGYVNCNEWAKNGHMEEAMRLLGYRPVDEAPKPAAEKKFFTKEDIKPGMVCILRNGVPTVAVPVGKGDGAESLELCELRDNRLFGMIKVDALTDDLREWNTADTSSRYDIMAVYGLTTGHMVVFTLNNPTANRKLLWERKEPKKVTKADIEKMFGCEVEIVDEEVQK